MMYNILSAMWHNKMRVFLILILSILTYSLALITLTNSFSFETQISAVENMFSSPLDATYKIDVSHIENFDLSGVALAELKQFINKQDYTLCGAYDVSGEYFDELRENQEYISLNKKAYAGTQLSKTPSATEVCFFDVELLNLISDGLLQETFFQPIEQNGVTYIPLYVGKDFENVLSLGDILTLSRNGSKYIVQGFLYDKRWFNDSDPITMPIESLNHKFFAPFSQIDKTDNITQQSTVGKILIVSEQNSQKLKDSISEKALQLGIKLRITSIRDFIKQWIEDNHQILRLNYYLTAIVLICSAISMISTLCVTVLLKKREYGIRIAFGTTKQQIIFSLCMEMLILNVIAGGVSFVYSYHSLSGSSISSFREIYVNTLCSYSLTGLILLVFFLATIVLLIPVIILNRYNPAELIKEDD